MRTDDRIQVLAIDSAGQVCGAALARNRQIVAESYRNKGPATGESLFVDIAEVLANAGVEVSDLSGLAVVTGPGSYTGLRLGLALLRGLALVDDLPSVGIGALELLAHAAGPEAALLCPLLQANRGRLYAAGYRRAGEELEEVFAPGAFEPDELCAELAASAGGWTFCSDETAALDAARELPGAAAAGAAFAAVSPRRAGLLAQLASGRLERGEGAAAHAVTPLYLGGVGAKPNRNRAAVAEHRSEVSI